MENQIVCKFGGTSVSNAEQINKVKDIISQNKDRQYVVVSAPGKENSEDEKLTDHLINIATGGKHFRLQHKSVGSQQSYKIAIEKFQKLIADLGIEGDDIIKQFEEDVKKSILREFPNILADDSSLKPLVKIFAHYFRGGEIPPHVALDWSGCSEFCRMVWTATQSIPWGEVKSYSWISLQIKIPRSFRAVGTALRKNPFPLLIPCHRVIRSNGTLGGFSAPAGVDLKRKLLKMEGVRFDKKGKVLFRFAQ